MEQFYISNVGDGDWKYAEQLGVQMLDMRRKVHGLEHSHTLASMTDLTNIHVFSGKVEWSKVANCSSVGHKKEVTWCSTSTHSPKHGKSSKNIFWWGKVEWSRAASIRKSVCCLKMLAGTWDAYPSISSSLKQKVRDQKWFFFVLFNTLKRWNLLVQPKSTTFLLLLLLFLHFLG